jgi:hypothetical protein
MGYDVTRFVVGDEWVYRLRDDCASERVRILAVLPKMSNVRLDVAFVDDPEGRVESIPAVHGGPIRRGARTRPDHPVHRADC